MTLTTAQSIAAYAPDPPAAALFIPVLIANLVTFSGVMVPYAQLTAFWRYWSELQTPSFTEISVLSRSIQIPPWRLDEFYDMGRWGDLQ